MARVIVKLGVVLLLAVAVALGLALSNSEDPAYELVELALYPRFHRYDDLIRSMAERRGLDPMLVKAVVWTESRFHPGKAGSAGERGLMQVTEIAAADWAAAEKIEKFEAEDLYDPKTNLEVGTWYLARARDRWKDQAGWESFALAEYNAGRSRVNRWVGDTNLGDRATGDDLRENISFRTTRAYVQTILDRRKFYHGRGRL